MNNILRDSITKARNERWVRKPKSRAGSETPFFREVAGMNTPLQHNGAQPMIQARGLVRNFGPTRALDGVDLDIERGTVLARLGPNGAGKTTIVRRADAARRQPR